MPVGTYPDTPVEIDVLANDFDPLGHPITIVAVVDQPDNGTIVLDPIDSTYTYTPNPGFVGVDSFTYVICDDGTPPLCDTALVVIKVEDGSPTNDPPIAVDDVDTTIINTPIDIDILGNDSDPNGDNIIITFFSATQHGSAVLNPI